jgi:hypothetical protein
MSRIKEPKRPAVPSAYDAVADYLFGNLDAVCHEHLHNMGYNPPPPTVVMLLKRDLRKIANELRQKGAATQEKT